MSGGMLWGGQQRDPLEMRIEITGLTRGEQPSDLITHSTLTTSPAFSSCAISARKNNVFFIPPTGACAT